MTDRTCDHLRWRGSRLYRCKTFSNVAKVSDFDCPLRSRRPGGRVYPKTCTLLAVLLRYIRKRVLCLESSFPSFMDHCIIVCICTLGLLWIDKARAKDKRNIWVSVWWKTTNLNKGIYVVVSVVRTIFLFFSLFPASCATPAVRGAVSENTTSLSLWRPTKSDLDETALVKKLKNINVYYESIKREPKNGPV